MPASTEGGASPRSEELRPPRKRKRLYEIITWRRIWVSMLVSGPVFFASAFMVLLPVRVFLDRREAQDILNDWKAGQIIKEDLTSDQYAILQRQNQIWPSGFGWLGSRWLEKSLITLFLVMVGISVLPFLIFGVFWAFTKLFK